MDTWERIVTACVLIGLLWSQRYSYRLGFRDGLRAQKDAAIGKETT